MESDSVGHSRIERNFHSRVHNLSTKRGAIVVDLFAGIGAGLLCLKRTGIKIDKVIHVEHCRVANAVYRDHHGQPDGQNNVFLRTFEQFTNELQDLMIKHGRTLSQTTCKNERFHVSVTSHYEYIPHSFLCSLRHRHRRTSMCRLRYYQRKEKRCRGARRLISLPHRQCYSRNQRSQPKGWPSLSFFPGGKCGSH